jgi:hypothetical protein
LWRPLALAAVLIATIAAGAASAQTVTVTKAPPKGSVVVLLDSTKVAEATADAEGIASLRIDLQAARGKAETDVRIYIDFCGDMRRVTLVESGYQPDQPPANCIRREVFGTFYLRQMTTLVVRASDQAPGVWIAQGPAPSRWLGNEVAGGSADETGSAYYVPNGFHIFAGGGIGRYGRFNDVACGLNTACAGRQTRLAGQFGLDYWVNSHLAFEAFYLRTTNPAAAGSGSDFTFASSQATNVAAVTGKVGVPFGRTRLYLQGGANYSWAKLTTTETFSDRTVSVNNVNQTIPGGTQEFVLQTRGLGWTISGGTEYWRKRWMALYLELGYSALRGHAVGGAGGGGEGNLHDSVFYAVAGLRFRLIGSR